MTLTSSTRILTALGALLAAGLAGFLIARLTTGGGAAPSKPMDSVGGGPAIRTHLDVDSQYLGSVGIQVQTAQAGNLATEIQTVVMIEAAPGAAASLTAKAAGTIKQLRHRLGESVHRGEVLAVIESREAASIAAERVTSAVHADLARANFEREKQLYEAHVTTRQDYEAAQAQLAAADAEARRAQAAASISEVSSTGTVEVRSPISGQVCAVKAVLGAYVQAEAELFRVVDASRLQLTAQLPEGDAATVTAGDPAELSGASGAGLSAHVVSVVRSLNAQTRTATVTFAADPGVTPSRDLLPGGVTPAIIRPRSTAQGIVVPDDAIQRIDGRDTVFVRGGSGFDVRPVTVGIRSGGRALILSGLEVGETLATRNVFLLKAELGKGGAQDEE